MAQEYKLVTNNRRKRCCIWGIAVLILLLLTFCFVNSGKYLVVNEKPEKAQAIVVFSGDKGCRMRKAAELYNAGYAPLIIISGGEGYEGLTMARVMAQHGERLGVPKDSIILEEKASTTWQNAEKTLEILKDQKLKNVLVVTSSFHTRRVSLTLERIYKPEKIQYHVIAAMDPGFNEKCWWSGNDSIMNTIKEYIKLAGYCTGKAN